MAACETALGDGDGDGRLCTCVPVGIMGKACLTYKVEHNGVDLAFDVHVERLLVDRGGWHCEMQADRTD